MNNFNNWDKVAQAFPGALGQVVRKTAFDVQAIAAQLAPVDTGNLKNSIYTKTSDGNNYPGQASEHIVEDQVPETDETTAYVAVGASYGIYQELGTVHMPSHPYLSPAVEACRPSFESALQGLEDKLKGVI